MEMNVRIPKWFTFVTDTSATVVSLIITVLLVSNEADERIYDNLFFLGLILVLYAGSYIYFGSHKAILRYFSVDDMRTIFKATLYPFLFCLVISHLLVNWPLRSILLFLLLHYLSTNLTLISVRLIRKYYYLLNTSSEMPWVNIVVFGGGECGRITIDSIRQEHKWSSRIISIIDDNSNKWGKHIHSIPIHSPQSILNDEWIKLNQAHQLIIAVQNISAERKKELMDTALLMGLKVRVVPPFKDWLEGNITPKQIREIQIEDLLGRRKIDLNQTNISGFLKDKVVLVTGAAGSIGSEICRQIHRTEIAKLILVDQAESSIYDIQQELVRQDNLHTVVFEVSNILDEGRMRDIFSNHCPDLVFHAAAYKHVPLIEKSPYEGIKVNIFGTRIIANLSVEFNVEKFIMVSTDKAVNPTNVMGATKRVAELYTQGLNDLNKTRFIVTRFGNVLGSNGSVIPLFTRQIKAGGPVTVTHEDITRYFMTIPEASSLVLEASVMGVGGEVFVFDMGEPVKIIELARKMIRLSGLIPDVDIKIKVVGLRPGEKLYEELLVSSENTLPTHNAKILRAKVNTLNPSFLAEKLHLLSHSLKTRNEIEMVYLLKLLVPEYKSKNSNYEALD